MELGFAAAIVATAALVVPRLPVAASDASFARQFPVAGTDVLERVDPDTRVLTEYGWGGYVIWRLYDAGGRVFVDGRGDMYDPAILEDYVSIRSADEGWQRLLDRYGVDALLVQPDAVVVRGPAQAAGWCELHRDAVQVLLRRCAHQRDGAASAGTSVRVPVRARTA